MPPTEKQTHSTMPELSPALSIYGEPVSRPIKDCWEISAGNGNWLAYAQNKQDAEKIVAALTAVNERPALLAKVAAMERALHIAELFVRHHLPENRNALIAPQYTVKEIHETITSVLHPNPPHP